MPAVHMRAEKGQVTAGVQADIHFLWLDLTRDCQLKCGHCYNESGPGGDRELLTLLGSSSGLMQPANWMSVLDQAKESGVTVVQLIGGEPTMYAGFPQVLAHAVMIGLKVEIYTNMVNIRAQWWDLFKHPHVSLATSYYSDDPEEHNRITERDSHRKTRANIIQAIALRIPLRVGIVQKYPTQRVREARAELEALGVRSDRIGLDKVRAFGRGQGDHAACDVNELCGHCGNGRAAIGPDGTVTPCIMSSWMGVGNARTQPLADIVAGTAMEQARAIIPKRVAADPCEPGAECKPDAYPCQPEA
ncbi:radical SAM protein [Catenulispora yoronensis]